LRRPFLRYITSDAGNFKRLYDAVKISLEFPDIASLQREILAERKTERKQKSSKRYPGKYFAPRSYEPHQSLARQLGILEKEERWRLAPSIGLPFLTIWDEDKQPPKYLLLNQFLRFDRAFAVPFLIRFLKEGKDNANKIVAELWDDLWKKFPKEMESAEPPLPISLIREDGTLKRTCEHYALFRLRFLTKEEGLHLDENQLKRIVKIFGKIFRKPEYPSNYYSKIGYIFEGKFPEIKISKEFEKEIQSAFKKFQQARYASAAAVFHYINNKILPASCLDSKEYLHYLRSSGSYSLHPTFKKDDVLFTVKGKM